MKDFESIKKMPLQEQHKMKQDLNSLLQTMEEEKRNLEQVIRDACGQQTIDPAHIAVLISYKNEKAAEMKKVQFDFDMMNGTGSNGDKDSSVLDASGVFGNCVISIRPDDAKAKSIPGAKPYDDIREYHNRQELRKLVEKLNECQKENK